MLFNLLATLTRTESEETADAEKSDITWLRDAFDSAVVVVQSSNARDHALGDKSLFQEIRKQSPSASVASNWPARSEASRAADPRISEEED